MRRVAGAREALRKDSEPTPEMLAWADQIAQHISDRVHAEIVGPLRDECERYRTALAYLAAPENWSSDPTSHDAVLYGHDTPYELAREALTGG